MIDAKKMKLFWQITALLYLICIAVLCFGRFDNAPDELPRMLFNIPMDKLGHFCMFVPSMIIAVKAFHNGTGKPGRFILFMLAAYLLSMALAAGIEVAQSFTTYRSGDILDFLADTIGISFGTIIIVAVQSATRKW